MTVSEAPSLTAEQEAALVIARAMANVGIPIFVAERDPAGIGHGGTGFWLPTNWQQTLPDPAVVDNWRPGMALCAVMGHGLDLLDFDPRNGGHTNALNGSTPISYGVATTPSGGVHSFIKSLGVGSRDNLFPGIDIKAGAPDGQGRGFAFLPPTVRPSKVTGELVAYRWAQTPDLERLTSSGQDNSGDALAALVLQARSSGGVQKVDGPNWWRAFVVSSEPQSELAAKKAINTKLEAVREWVNNSGSGFREVLLTAAFTLGGYVGGGYVDEDDARELLREAVRDVWTDTDTDDELWIDQGLCDGQLQPFHVFTEEQEREWKLARLQSGPTGDDCDEDSSGQQNGDAPPPDVYTFISRAEFDPRGGTDQELAELVVQRMYPALRFASDSAQWVVRGPIAWSTKDDAAPWATAQLARLMPLGDPELPKKKEDYTVENWTAVRRMRFMNAGTSGPIERKMKAVTRMSGYFGTVEVGELDTDPEILWAGGVAWNLRASRGEPVKADIDAATPHLRTALCLPEKRETPVWDYLVRTVWPDREIRSWALRVLSISLAGYPDAALPVLYGPERTGKTALVSLLVRVLGSYGHAADPRLLGTGEGTHASVVYALKGRRLSFIDEGPRRGHLASERLKQLTGGGELTGNEMRANPVTFSPTHTLVMTTNDEPPITDPALRARMRVVPCEADQAKVRAARQALTPEIWGQEAPGVLAKMMAECAAWLGDWASASTEKAPSGLVAVVDEMAAGQDPVQEWVDNWTIRYEEGTSGRALYHAFRGWYEGHPTYRRASAPTETAFGRVLTDLGHHVMPNCGPKGNQKYRPLTVMRGGDGGAPWEPTQLRTLQVVGNNAPEGSDSSPTVSDGSEPQLSESKNSRSNPISSSSSDSSDSYSCTSTTSKHTSPIYSSTPSPICSNDEKYIEGNRENSQTVGTTPPQNTSDLHQRVSPDSRSASVGNRRNHDQVTERSRNDNRARNNENQSLSVVKITAKSESPLDPQRTEIARRAAEAKSTKAEARAVLKAEQIAEAVVEASGEILSLPAVVDRQGHVVPVNEDQVRPVLQEILQRSEGVLTVDVETSGYPPGHNLHRLRSVQLGDEGWAVVLDPEANAELIRDTLASATKLHAHSATADLVPLEHAGLIDMDSGWARMYDTVIPAKLGDPKSTGPDPGLKKLSEAVLGVYATAPGADEARLAVFKAGKWITGKQSYVAQLTTPIERNGWAQINTCSEVMLRYAASDVLDTHALAKRLPPVDDAVIERERTAEEMCARVTHRGLQIDAERVQKLTETHGARAADLLAQIGSYSLENPKSGLQCAEAFARVGHQVSRTDKGNPEVNDYQLKLLRRTQPDTDAGRLASLIIDWRKSNTVLNMFLKPYREMVENGDGRVRPTIYTLSADTGRFSSVRPNCQQLPKKGGVRSIYKADPGHVFISADFSGVELRGAAAMSQDPVMMQMIAEEDAGRFDGFHWAVARQAFGPDATPEDRTVAKIANFGCVPLDVEILTQRGWLTHDQVERGDKTPGRASDGSVRWTPVTGVYVYDDAPLMRIHGGQTWEATTTPQHRWAATRRRDGGARGRYFEDEWTTTETIAKEHTVHLGGLLDAPGTLDISPDEAALIAWTVTDGSVSFAPITGRTAQGRDGRRRYAKVQIFQAKPDGVVKIKKLLADLGLDAKESELPIGHKRTMPSHIWVLPGQPMRELFGRAGLLTDDGFNRARLEHFILGLSTPARLSFLEAAIEAEGNRNSQGRVMISQNEGETCDAIELAGYLCGYHVTRSVNDRRGNAVNYKLRLGKPYVTGQKLLREDAGRAAVWCVSTGLGTWTMRQKGQIMLTGNTFYGGGAATLSRQIGIPEQEMVVIRDSLKSIAPTFFQWSNQLSYAVRKGMSEYRSYSGRIIHFHTDTPHKAPAFVIQGSCRELLIDALIRWKDTRWGHCSLMPVHDELIVQVPAEDAHEAMCELVKCMAGELFGVKIVAEPDDPDEGSVAEGTARWNGSPFWRDG